MPVARPRPSLAEVVWPKVEKHEGQCWIWIGAKNHLGYGQIRFRGKHISAHRATWLLVRGYDGPPNAHFCHKCDNPWCVNPDHIFIGDAKANMHDCIAKGRFKFLKPRPGEANNKAKLTWDVVRAARKAHAEGAPAAFVARAAGVANSTMREVLAGRNWREAGVKVAPMNPPSARFSPDDYADMGNRIRAGQTQRSISQHYHMNINHLTRLKMHGKLGADLVPSVRKRWSEKRRQRRTASGVVSSQYRFVA